MAQIGAKKAEAMTITVTDKENVIKKNFGKRWAIPLDFDFLTRDIYLKCFLQRADKHNIGRVFNNKIWAMIKYAFEYWQHSSWQW